MNMIMKKKKWKRILEDCLISFSDNNLRNNSFQILHDVFF